MGQSLHLVLGSLRVGRAIESLDLQRVLFVPTAANSLGDRAEIVEIYRSQLTDAGVQVVDWEIEQHVPGDDIPQVDALFVSGGNPYRLVAACRTTGFDQIITDLLRRGVPYIGASAGALVASPSLDPIALVSPFPRPEDFEGAALGLTELLVLPHDNRRGRRESHAAAQAQHGASHRMLAITDDETVSIGVEGWRLTDHVKRHQLRPAEVADADAIARCYVAAGRAAWRFVESRRLETLEPPVDAWAARLHALPDRDDLLVLEDGQGLGGFVWTRPASDTDLDADVGEVGALYTHPRLWGQGAGRRLLTLALDRLRAGGSRTAVLYTEERNTRPRQLYERLGWQADGSTRAREFVGATVREVRYRLTL